MKKTITLILSLLLLISSFGFIFVRAENNTVTEIDQATNWTVYDGTSQSIGETGQLAGAWAKAELDTTGAHDSNGDGQSVYLKTKWQRAVKTFEVEKNKDYYLSFKYYTNTTITIESSYVCSVASAGIAPENSNIVPGKDGYYAYVGYNSAYTAVDGLIKNRKNFNDTTISDSTGIWQEIKVPFSSGNNQKMSLVLCVVADEIWLDELTLLEKKEENPPTPPINEWTIYSSESQFIGTNGILAGSWTKVFEDKSGAHDSNGDQSSYYIKAKWQKVAKLITVEKNKQYYFSFKYYTDSTATVSSNISSFFAVGIAAENGAVVPGKDGFYSCISNGSAYTANDGLISNRKNFNATISSSITGEFQEVNIPFYSGNNEKMFLVLTPVVEPIWLDELELHEGSIPVPPKDYGTPKDVWTIDFEDSSKQYSATDGIDVVDVIGYNGQKTKALHTVPGKRDGALFLNYNTTTFDNDPIYTIPLLPKRIYELSWRVKIKENTGTIKWLAFITCYNGERKDVAILNSAKQGEWLQYKVLLQTQEEQDHFSFAFNAGTTAPEMWVDDIQVALTNYTTFEGWNIEQGKYLVDFEAATKYFTDYNSNTRFEIAETNSYEGKTTRALHVLPGSYTSTSYLNYTTTMNDTDPVFSFPVESGKAYRFSFRFKFAPKQRNIGFFSAYATYKGTTLSQMTAFNLAKAPSTDIWEGNWMYYSVRFIAGKDQDKVTFAFNASKNPAEAWFDDILVEKIQPGVQETTKASYCEDFYNLALKSNHIESALQTKKQTVIAFHLKANTFYTLGAAIAANSGSKLYLSFDGQEPIKSYASELKTSVFSSDGLEKRLGFNFMTNDTGLTYLIVQNNQLNSIKDLSLFETYAIAGASDWIFGKENKPEVDQSELQEAKELIVFGSKAEAEFLNESVISEGEIPKTGETNAVIPALVILVSSTLLVVITTQKNKKGCAI